MFVRIAAFFMGMSVLIGAFGAHVVQDLWTPKMLDILETAVLYQFIHGLALLILAMRPSHWVVKGGIQRLMTSMSIGIVLFSGSLYGYLCSMSSWVIITPIGGVLLVLCWLWLMLGVRRESYHS